MIDFDPQHFGDTVMRDFRTRRLAGDGSFRTASLNAVLESKALGHPAFEGMGIGERRTAPMVAVYLDLTDFTGRTFWDDEGEVADLAHAVLSGFVNVVSAFGGYPLGLRGDGLFAGFGPGDARVDAVFGLSACAFALNAVQTSLNTQLEAADIRRVQARAGLDYGRITFVRSGTRESSEVNAIGFAANFAAKCEKKAKSWEIVIGESIVDLLPDHTSFTEHGDSPKSYQRDDERRYYRFFDYHWRKTLPYIPGTIEQIGGHSTAQIAIN
jgi:class 3 adenylate cyclase